MSTEVDLAYYSKPVDVAVEKDGSLASTGYIQSNLMSRLIGLTI